MKYPNDLNAATQQIFEILFTDSITQHKHLRPTTTYICMRAHDLKLQEFFIFISSFPYIDWPKPNVFHFV